MSLERASSTPRKTKARNRTVGLACIVTLCFIVLHHSRSYLPSAGYEKASGHYDLPKYLNIPSFVNAELSPDGRSIGQSAARVAATEPVSILRFYRSLPQSCGRHPFRPHLRSAIEQYGTKTGYSEDEMVRLLRKDNTILLHFVSAKASEKNDTSLARKFAEDALLRAGMFNKVVLLATRGPLATKTDVKKDLRFLKGRLEKSNTSVVVSSAQGTDQVVYQMYSASHFLAHRGSLSALGALACGGRVFYTSQMDDFLRNNEFRWLISNGERAKWRSTYGPRAALDYVGKVQPSCCSFESFGKGDGEKIICANSKRFFKKACWVLSVGCGGKWSFERSITEKTGCQIHTFDCSRTYEVPADLKGRATIHKLCLGQENDTRPNFIGWNEMIARGASLSGMSDEKMPALAKMDIEGHEFPVLQSLVASGKEEILPEQLALEVHSTSKHNVGPPYFPMPGKEGNYMVSNETIFGLFYNLSARGYRLVHRADNPFCAHCSEVTMVRTVGLPDIK